MCTFKRIFVVVMDSVGIGEAPDAAAFGDEGADTLGHIAAHMGGLNVPTMRQLGLGNIRKLKGVAATKEPLGFYTKMKEASASKDTMTGHWEIMGLYIDQPFQVFPDGFPKELIDALEKATGRKVIGNKVASGTEIIEELGKEHMETGALIVYTSADSVLQIAAHEAVIPVDELYHICNIARKLTMTGDFLVGRVIARPFIGETGHFERTPNRHDYALKPFGKTVMDSLKAADYDVISLGKIVDIFDGEGITKATRTVSNDDGMVKLTEMMEEDFTGLCFLNLVDFDSKYGHRRNPQGYGEALERFDSQLPAVLDKLHEDDLLMITADHGNDPVFRGTDHTREYVPLLVYHHTIETGGELAVRKTFSDIGATVADNFKVSMPEYGTSFLKEIQAKDG